MEDRAYAELAGSSNEESNAVRNSISLASPPKVLVGFRRSMFPNSPALEAILSYQCVRSLWVQLGRG